MVGVNNLDILDKSYVFNGVENIPASHGCFDNSVDIMGRALGYIVDPINKPKIHIEWLTE